MAYIAPRLKQKLGVDLITEAIGSVMMRDRISAQGSSPRITIAHWDVPVGIDVCDKGGCAPIDFSKASNLKALPDWAYSKNAAEQNVVLTAGVVGVGILYNEAELKQRMRDAIKANCVKTGISANHFELADGCRLDHRR